MSLKIFHTSDLHLGMKFAGYPEVQAELSEARFKTLEKLIEYANKEKCDLFVVAGDLFDRVSVPKRDVIRAAQILNEFQGHLVAILPGNHDFITRGPTDLWAYFKDNAGDNVKLLEKKEPCPLNHYDLDINLYPAPCDAKHSSENYISWIRESEKDNGVKYHIGIAHGSLKGFSPDFDKKYYPMTVSELLECGLDLWLMGHTHIQYPEKPGAFDKIYYPSTPEPDGFDCTHKGKAWILEMDDEKKVLSRSISTGIFQFLHAELLVNSSVDVKKLKDRYSSEECSKVLLKLKLKGRLPKGEYRNLSGLKGIMEGQLFYLLFDDSEVAEEITPEDINREFTEGSFPHRLLSILVEKGDHEALQAAYDLILEGKK